MSVRQFDANSNIERFTLKHSTTGQGLTGLTFETSGLIVSTICDNEATPAIYTVAAGNVEDIAALGTYAAPTASKCRFKQVDATNHKGLYEFQFADARYSVASSKRLVISATGAANLLDADYEIELVRYDPFDGVRLGLTALPNAAADAPGGLPISDAGGLDLDTKLANAVPTTAAVADKVLVRNIAGGSDGGRTVTSALRLLRNKWTLAGGTLTVTEEDDTTSAWTAAVTSDAAANPIIGSDPT